MTGPQTTPAVARTDHPAVALIRNCAKAINQKTSQSGNMRSRLLLIITACLLSVAGAQGQTATTEALHKKYSEALDLFFYNNTLRMINQAEDKQFDELIKDIEKMRFLMIKKSEMNFGAGDYKKLLADYRSESFESIMTSRHEGKNFDVFLREQGGKRRGMLVLINDTDNLYVLDILGSIAVNKVTQFFSTLDESTDLRKRIAEFAGDDDDDKKKKSADN
jgi:hypothetical protein